jgi:molecular chaperone DnaK (HSP70)
LRIEKAMSERVVGISLGGTFSAVAHVNACGRAEAIPNADGEVLTPSAALIEGGRIVVGRAALSQWVTREDHVVRWIKRSIGDPDYRFQGLSPVEISAAILRSLKDDAERALGLPIEEAVLGCPACFAPVEVESTRRAGELAGLRVREVVREPTATAVHHRAEHGLEDGTVLVCDLGGSTFDATVLQVGKGGIQPRAFSGDRKLGGHDWTTELVTLAAERFRAKHGNDPRDDLSAAQLLYEVCEAAKRDLSRAQAVSICCRYQQAVDAVAIAREEFEGRTEYLIQQVVAWSEQALARVHLTWKDIDQILLAGGSSRLRRLPEALRERSGRPPVTVRDADLATACGAALLGRGPRTGARAAPPPAERATGQEEAFSRSTAMTPCFGIALGATYSAISWFDDYNGRVETIDLESADGARALRSVVHYPAPGQLPVVGEAAHRAARTAPDRVIAVFERSLGTAWKAPPIDGVEHTATQVTAEVLRVLARDASTFMGELVRDVVIAVPAYFGESERAATVEAGKLAGLNVLALVPEPSATALAFSAEKVADITGRHLLVYDLGGSTFDLALLRVTREAGAVPGGLKIEVLCTEGNPHLGGRDWDRALAELVAEKVQQAYGIDIFQDPANQALLLDNCESARRQLTRAPTTATIVADRQGRQVEVSAQELEARTRDLLLQTQFLVERVLEQAEEKHGLGKDQIEVMLAGGASRMPAIKKMLEDLTGRPPLTHRNPDLLVTIGASWWAHLLQAEATPAAGERKSVPRMAGLVDLDHRGAPFDSGPRESAARVEAPVDHTADRPAEADSVHFTVTGPTTLVPGRSYLIDVWAHLEKQRQEVLERARQADGAQGVRQRSSGGVRIERGTRLSFRLKVPGLLVRYPTESVSWEGDAGNATFPVAVPADAPAGPYAGTVTVRAEELLVARLHFLLVVGTHEAPAEALPVREARLRTAFASYASKDREEVLARVQGMQKVLPDLDVFVDVATLRSGEHWAERLMAEIFRREVFYLFWSRAASQSEWVQKEWRAALEGKGIDAIDPVPLAPPDEVPPPPELARHLHFNDWTLAYHRGKGRESSPEDQGSGPVVSAASSLETGIVPDPQRNGPPHVPAGDRGFFVVVQLVPDLRPGRLKLGFVADPQRSLAEWRQAAPTAVLLKAWACRATWEAAALDCLTRKGCWTLGNQVLDCAEPEAILADGEAFFRLMPGPSSEGSSGASRASEGVPESGAHPREGG